LRELGFDRSTGKASDELPRYALLLNPDTELEPSSLADMLSYLDRNPGVGVAGPKLILPDGNLDLACRRSFPSPEVSLWRMVGFSKLFPRSRRFARYNLTFLDENRMAEVDSVVGAFMMVRSECIHRVGLLDDTFFMYGEDLDWCKRIKEAGWKVMYYPEVHVLHVKRAASRKSQRAQFEFVRAMLLFYNKHYRDRTGWLMNLAVLGGIALQGGPRLWPEIPRNAQTGGR
jgi:GT2 family glycosyltransferase